MNRIWIEYECEYIYIHQIIKYSPFILVQNQKKIKMN